MPSNNLQIDPGFKLKSFTPHISPTVSSDSKATSALRLHHYLVDRHWNGHALVGPDMGIRFNARIGRFIKSYLSGIRWKDDYYYVQGQSYWILDNWKLFSITGERKYQDVALRCTEYMLTRQRDGAWMYPNPEWHGRIATAEGSWGSLGLLESYRQSRDIRYLNGAILWHEFLVRKIGFQQMGSELAVNYFYAMKGSRVPNNSTLVLRLLAELADATGMEKYLGPCTGLLTFLQAVQAPTGEFPYRVQGEPSSKYQQHFQCYQYNAFECLDLMCYYDFTRDMRALALIRRVLNFLRSGLTQDGHALFDCHNRYRAITYHTAVLAQAFVRAGQLGIEGYDALADRAYTRLLEWQRPDGGFDFSRGDYLILKDKRSYPRNLAMILFHLLPVAAAQGNARPKYHSQFSARTHS